MSRMAAAIPITAFAMPCASEIGPNTFFSSDETSSDLANTEPDSTSVTCFQSCSLIQLAIAPHLVDSSLSCLMRAKSCSSVVGTSVEPKKPGLLKEAAEATKSQNQIKTTIQTYTYPQRIQQQQSVVGSKDAPTSIFHFPSHTPKERTHDHNV